MIKVILFDCNGLLVKRTKRFSQRLAEDFGIPLESTQPFFEGRFLLCETGKADLKQELTTVMAQWGWKESLDKLLKEWFEGESELDRGCIDHIRALRQKGRKCFLCTNSEKYRTDYLWNQLGLKYVLDGFFSSAFVGYLKQDFRYWVRVYYQLANFLKEEILVWDNKSEMVAAAKAFGFRAELFENFKQYQTIMKHFYEL